MGGVHGDPDPSHGDRHTRSDLEELEAQRSGRGAGEPGAVQSAPQRTEEEGGEGGEEEPELVGGEAGGGCPIGEQIELLFLDGVLHPAAGAVNALGDGPGRDGPGQRGDDEAGVGLAGQMLGLGDDAAAGATSWSGSRTGTP